LLKRLRSTGEVVDPGSKPADTPEKIVRRVILVHSGPGGAENNLNASNGDISFDEKRIRAVVENHNALIAKLAVDYGGFDKMPIGAYPAILDSHSEDSANRILGRLTGLLKFERRDVPKVGKDVACAVSETTFLGRDTVDKVLDGRYYHVSVGIDENTNTLGEVSIVVDPAAPGAMVLKRRAIKKQTNTLKGARVSKVKLARLKKLSSDLAQLAKKSEAQRERVSLAKRKVDVQTKFTKLMADKKVTPAEFKKVDVLKLAKLDKGTLDTVLEMYEQREPLLLSGQQGSVAAANFSDVRVESKEDREVRKLKLAAKKNLAKQGVKFKESEDDEDEEPTKKLALDAPAISQGQESEIDMPGDEDQSSQDTEELVQQVEENATQIARVASMVEAIIEEMGKPDGDDESPDEGAPEETEMSSDDKDDDAKDDDDKKDDDKKELSEDDKDQDKGESK
jgi:hypothetical protein